MEDYYFHLAIGSIAIIQTSFIHWFNRKEMKEGKDCFYNLIKMPYKHRGFLLSYFGFWLTMFISPIFCFYALCIRFLTEIGFQSDYVEIDFVQNLMFEPKKEDNEDDTIDYSIYKKE